MLEDTLHKHIIQWLEIALPDNSVYHHSPNEGIRHIAFRKKLKAMGMVSGWPDSLQQVKLWLNTLVELKKNPRMQIIERMCP